MYEPPDPHWRLIPFAFGVESDYPMADRVIGPHSHHSIDFAIAQMYDDSFSLNETEPDKASIDTASKTIDDFLAQVKKHDRPSQDEPNELGLGFDDDMWDEEGNGNESGGNTEVPLSGVPDPLDVKTGNCKTLHKLPGNVQLREFVKAHYDDYEKVKGNAVATTEFYQAIIDEFGGRFWKEEQGMWVEMNRKDIHVVMTNRFRGVTKMRKRKKKPKRKKPTEASGASSKRRKTNKKPSKKKGQRTH